MLALSASSAEIRPWRWTMSSGHLNAMCAIPWGWPHSQCLRELGPTSGGKGASPTTWRSRKLCDFWPHTWGITHFVRLQYRRLFELSLSEAAAVLEALWDWAATSAAAFLALSFFPALFELCGCFGICSPRPSPRASLALANSLGQVLGPLLLRSLLDRLALATANSAAQVGAPDCSSIARFGAAFCHYNSTQVKTG